MTTIRIDGAISICGSFVLNLEGSDFTEADIASLFSGTVTEGYWPTDGSTDMYQESSKTTLVASDGDIVGAIEGVAGSDVDLLSTDRGTWNETAGLLNMNTGGDPDDMTAALASRSANTYVACVLNTTDSTGAIIGGAASHFVIWQSGSSNSPFAGVGASPQIWVDGVLQAAPTRDSLHDLLADGADHLVELLVDLTSSGWATLFFNDYEPSSFQNSGLMGDFLLMADPGVDSRVDVSNVLMAKHNI